MDLIGVALGACRAWVVEPKVRLREDSFSAIRRPIAALWAKTGG
jgi:hypothetical protein